jgi:hypothetical protein
MSRQQVSDDDTGSYARRGEVRAQVCPPEVVSEWLTRCPAWGERERSLTHLVRVSSVIARSPSSVG